ncbi:MAG: hypothetical protein K2Z80_27000 [Xanthobacteraceae bacterium]|nr:hypothetical protein [Xanthobacteraceae bacterium]
MVWTKLATVRMGGGLIACAAGAALYISHQATVAADAACHGLRSSILSTLAQNADARVKSARVYKDLAEFERSCARRDPDAKAVYSAVDRTILFTGRSDAEAASSRPVRFVPPPPGFERRWPGVWLPPPPPEEFRRRPFGT